MKVVTGDSGAVKWESLADLDDSFPEPAENKSHPRAYVIRVFHDTDTGDYTAYWGREKIWMGKGRSAASALRELADRFETANIHGSDREFGESVSRKASVICKYCDVPIFFAKLPYPSTKFLAFDPESIEAGQVTDVKTARFLEDTNGTGRAMVVWSKSTTTGPVWIPHPECCGKNPKEPKNPVLKARWEERRKASKKLTEDKSKQVISGLMDIAADIDKEILNDK